ncbi:beta-lactamase/transpeptidase-like protein [Lasiosphaeria hispida]|uniref:Beta-lactamase/transpeptidase-like protein n=1 Tax=Lasiosphaeria hispida TaxID=260671 RepID=A0AAJ0MCI5_9PEZI|nr:beta-lactamase/transpeptidase-like protein [Lasiosphaeria hispida]
MIKFFKLLALVPAATAVALECHPEGPILPRPHNLTQAKTFQAALSNLTDSLDAAFTSKIRGGWDIRNVSLSIGLVGLEQTEPTIPLWEYHHLASGNVNGTKTLDRHSQYLIGSVSKVISDAILLRSGVDLDDPITKYLLSLANESSLVSWENITLRQLSSQLAGIPPNYGFSEYYYIKDYFEALGFPHLNDSAYQECGIIGLNGACTEQQLLDGLLKTYPIAPPQSRPIYSNIAFTLFTLALSAKTNLTYAQLLDTLTAPLNMTSTLPSPGTDSLAVIPPVANSWGTDYGPNAPGGGLVSTLSDLTSFLHAILSRSPMLGLSPTQTNEWLQPRAFTGSRSSFVGAPWEIFRPEPELLFPSYDAASGQGGHTVTVLAKDGAAYGYRARVALLDEYGVGLVLLTAGDADALTSVFDAALSVLVPALEGATREEGEREYAGTFAGRSTRETGEVEVNASVALDGASLRLTGLARNGTDVLESLGQLWAATIGGFLSSIETTGVHRLYPAGITREGVLADGTKVLEEDWRLSPDLVLNSNTELPGKGISGNDCLGWTLVDWMYYGSESVDRFVFVKDAGTGSVLGLDLPFLRTGSMGKARVE